VIVDAVAEGLVEDVHIIPISLGYDRIVENDNYIKELTGGEKKAERLFAFLSSTSNLIVKAMNKKLCFGQINVGFGEAISISNYLRQEVDFFQSWQLFLKKKKSKEDNENNSFASFHFGFHITGLRSFLLIKRSAEADYKESRFQNHVRD